MKTHFFQWFSAVAVLTVVVIIIIVAVVLTSGKTPLTLLFLNFIKEFEFFKRVSCSQIFSVTLLLKGFQYCQMKEMVLDSGDMFFKNDRFYNRLFNMI